MSICDEGSSFSSRTDFWWICVCTRVQIPVKAHSYLCQSSSVFSLLPVTCLTSTAQRHRNHFCWQNSFILFIHFLHLYLLKFWLRIHYLYLTQNMTVVPFNDRNHLYGKMLHKKLKLCNHIKPDAQPHMWLCEWEWRYMIQKVFLLFFSPTRSDLITWICYLSSLWYDTPVMLWCIRSVRSAAASN